MNKNSILGIALLIMLCCSCSILKTKDKTSSSTQTDTNTQQSSSAVLVDTSKSQSFQRLTFELPAGYFNQDNEQNFSLLAELMVNAAKNQLAANKNLQNKVAGNHNREPKTPAAEPPDQGLKGILETWNLEHKGLSLNTKSDSTVHEQTQQDKQETHMENKSYSLFTIIGINLACILFLYLVLLVLKKKS